MFLLDAILLFIVYNVNCQPITNCYVIDPSSINLEYPIETNTTYTINFNTTIMQANYAKYITTSGSDGCKSSYLRNDPYGIDTIKNNDYTNTTYNRGHLVPKEDYGCDTMIISNAVPMIPNFNQGAWKSSEEYIRKNYATFITYKGCEYLYNNYIISPTGVKLYIPIGCYYVIFSRDNTSILDYGYYKNNKYSYKEYQLPYWIKCNTNF